MGKLWLFNSGRAQTFFLPFSFGVWKERVQVLCFFGLFQTSFSLCVGNAIEPSWVGFYLLCVQWSDGYAVFQTVLRVASQVRRKRCEVDISFLWLMGLTGPSVLLGLAKRRWFLLSFYSVCYKAHEGRKTVFLSDVKRNATILYFWGWRTHGTEFQCHLL